MKIVFEWLSVGTVFLLYTIYCVCHTDHHIDAHTAFAQLAAAQEVTALNQRLLYQSDQNYVTTIRAHLIDRINKASLEEEKWRAECKKSIVHLYPKILAAGYIMGGIAGVMMAYGINNVLGKKIRLNEVCLCASPAAGLCSLLTIFVYAHCCSMQLRERLVDHHVKKYKVSSL